MVYLLWPRETWVLNDPALFDQTKLKDKNATMTENSKIMAIIGDRTLLVVFS